MHVFFVHKNLPVSYLTVTMLIRQDQRISLEKYAVQCYWLIKNVNKEDTFSYTYSVDHQWRFGKSIPFYRFGWHKVGIILEQWKVAFLSPSKICENLNFREKFKFAKISLGDKNATSLCSKNISTLLYSTRQKGKDLPKRL